MAEPCQLAFRTLKGIGILDTDPVYQSPSGFERPEGNLRCCAYSPDGRFFAWASPERVSVVDPSVGHVVATLPTNNVYELGFSPLGTYIITWQRPSKDEDGNAVKNLKVWQTLDKGVTQEDERAPVGQFVQKSQTGWNLQYTADEQFCARAVTNEVQFYQTTDLGTVWNKLRVEGVSEFALAPGRENSVAVFVPERKGQPAAVKVYNVPQFDQARSQKTFYKGDKVQLKWNDQGTSLIVLAQTDVDKSNRSYYGETNLYILSANGGFDSRIQLDKEGPIHDVTWSPNSREFGVVYGYMPAKTTIFNTKAEPKHSFSLGPRNTILFSPYGRFVLVAGFGNLAGQCDIYDVQKDYQKVCTIEASNASVCEWSPDAKQIMTATTSPRLRVDNGVRIWHVGGGLMYNEDMTELYDVKWRPQSVSQNPPTDLLTPIPTPHASALAYLGTVKTPSKPSGAYRPPGARGTSTPLHFKREDEGGAAYNASAVGSSHGTTVNGYGSKPGRGRREVPGAEAAPASTAASLPPGAAPGGGVSLNVQDADDANLSKAALKNKKKREAKKAKSEAAKADGEPAPPHQPQGVDGASDRHRDLLDPNKPHRDRSKSPRKQKAPKDDGNRDNNSNNGRGHYRSPSREWDAARERSRSRARSPSKLKASQSAYKPAPSGLSSSPSGATNNNSNSSNAAVKEHTTPTLAKPSVNTTLPPGNPAVAEAQGTAADADLMLSPGSGSPLEKRTRALMKKLRAIEELKMRQAGGEKLELSQMSKIGTEESVRKELESLGVGTG